ncbi:MAG: hypothetical protein F4075_06460, partial [Acidobacteria bacterium]|nr:hypothetical protein [Acidobacteriota bacterium]
VPGWVPRWGWPPEAPGWTAPLRRRRPRPGRRLPRAGKPRPGGGERTRLGPESSRFRSQAKSMPEAGFRTVRQAFGNVDLKPPIRYLPRAVRSRISGVLRSPF